MVFYSGAVFARDRGGRRDRFFAAIGWAGRSVNLLLLNQFSAQSGAPTGRLAEELAEHLRARGHQATCVSSDDAYGVSRRGAARWRHELAQHGRLFRRAWAARPVDALIALTSPACLPVTAALVARRLGCRLYLWNMDLYPDLALALGELRPGLLARQLRRAMAWAYRSATALIALDEDMQTYLQEVYRCRAAVISPWPPDLTWPPPGGARSRGSGTPSWLYSGNLGRAHEAGPLLRVQQELERAGVAAELVFQGRGAQWATAQALAERLGLRRVVWRAAVPEVELTASLQAAEVLIVTRRPEMCGLLWPSKLALARLSGRPILWLGETNSATARELRATGRHGVFRPEETPAIAAWLRETFADRSAYATPPISPAVERAEQMRRWDALIAGESQSEIAKTAARPIH